MQREGGWGADFLALNFVASSTPNIFAMTLGSAQIPSKENVAVFVLQDGFHYILLSIPISPFKKRGSTRLEKVLDATRNQTPQLLRFLGKIFGG
jgi:hypothetical protein